MYKEIIKKNWRNSSEEVMNRSVDLVAELLEEVKDSNPEEYWRFIRKQQGLMSGGHYDEEFARYDVKHMWHTTKHGEKRMGEHWSVEQAKQVMREHGLSAPINEFDVYVALNAFWHDLSEVITEEGLLIEAAIAFWFEDDDFKASDKVWWYMCSKAAK